MSVSACELSHCESLVSVMRLCVFDDSIPLSMDALVHYIQLVRLFTGPGLFRHMVLRQINGGNVKMIFRSIPW